MYTHIKKRVKLDNFEKAKAVYSILFGLNNVQLTTGELNLISYTAVYGTLSSPPIRENFINKFSLNKNTVYNLLSKLQKRKILVKGDDKKIRLNNKLVFDFKNNITLNVTIDAHIPTNNGESSK